MTPPLDARSAHTAETRERVGTITDVMARYDVDPAGAWSMINNRSALVTNPDGNRVALVTDPDEREGPNGTLWIVFEVPAP